MKKVFVVNKSSHDYSNAEEFGNLVFMTEGSLNRFSTSKMFRLFEKFIIRSKPHDYILISGMTVMCCIACSMFASKHGRLNLLIYKPDPTEPGTYVERITIFKEGQRVYGKNKQVKGKEENRKRARSSNQRSPRQLNSF